MRHSDQRHLDVDSCPKLEAAALEKVLSEALREAVGEMFFVNAGNLVAYIAADKVANIEDLVASSTERSLRPGAVRYGGYATSQFDWGCPPHVTIHLEFHHGGLSIYFQLVFEASAVGVRISSIVFPNAPRTHDERLSRLGDALTGARRLSS